MKYVLALDQGTTSSRAVLFDQHAAVKASCAVAFDQHYPKPGWVSHRPQDILNSQLEAMRGAIRRSGVDAADICAVGISNQRETALAWDARTGEPLCDAIVWQCRRTAPLCLALTRAGHGERIREKTGLLPDAYFSGTKFAWMLANEPGVKQAAQAGTLRFGTVDSFLIWHLTGGKTYVTDPSNASRTMLMNLNTCSWDDELLALFGIKREHLPRIVDTSGVVGQMDTAILGREIPIAALAGDQQAALFGQGCVERGMVKNTYGTGCFVLMQTGETPVWSQNRLLTTVAWTIGGKTAYALEGSVFVAGAVVQWLRDELGLIQSAQESEAVARSVADTGGVYVVPAFTGLGAPYWDMYARGTIVGLTRGTGRAHLVRAALESIAYQSCDVIRAMEKDSRALLPLLRVDGGASQNDFLMQLQSDLLGVSVVRMRNFEVTAQGAAFLAGLGVGLWQWVDLSAFWQTGDSFTPTMPREQAGALLDGWHKAVGRSQAWANP